jgi:hypothetical protein
LESINTEATRYALSESQNQMVSYLGRAGTFQHGKEALSQLGIELKDAYGFFMVNTLVHRKRSIDNDKLRPGGTDFLRSIHGRTTRAVSISDA